jgi:hypothetical protein
MEMRPGAEGAEYRQACPGGKRLGARGRGIIAASKGDGWRAALARLC